MSIDEIIGKAAKAVGGQTKLVHGLGLGSQGTISAWRRIGRIPSHHVLAIEKLTQGAVSRHEMRPDLYPPESDPLQTSNQCAERI